jgi:hypothetical protein
MIRSTSSRAGRQQALEQHLDQAHAFLDEVDERNRVGRTGGSLFGLRKVIRPFGQRDIMLD